MNPCECRNLTADQLPATAESLNTSMGDTPSAHGRMQFAYALPEADGSLCLHYVLSQGARQPYGLWRVPVPVDNTLPSLTPQLPLLGWYEREMADLYGLRFTGHPEPYPLVLHESERVSPPPCRRPFDPGERPVPRSPLPPTVPSVLGADIQRLPYGPIRADVVESAQFLFFYIGEGILHYHPQLFYKHRGMEARFVGRTLMAGSVLAERVSGIDSVAHALAFAQAVEAALNWPVPLRALIWRVILAELERLYNHLHYFGLLAKTTTLKVAEAEGLLLEEQIKQINGKLTGSRFLRGLIVPGGLRRDLNPGDLNAQLAAFERVVHRYLHKLSETRSYLDRLLTTGVLARQVAFDQGATGPIERASALDRDLRRDHPYGLYAEFDLRIPVEQDGDAFARAEVRAAEIRQSFGLIRQALARLSHGDVANPRPLESGETQAAGLGWVEGTRGGLLYAVHLDEQGRLRHVKIKDPSFSNWRVFPFTVQDTNLMDYAINEASFGLSIAGADR